MVEVYKPVGKGNGVGRTEYELNHAAFKTN